MAVIPPAASSAAAGPPLLSVEDVHRSFRLGPETVPILRGVTLRLPARASAAITGRSGSGKSTLLHIMGGLDRPTSGRVTLAGVDPFDLDEPELAAFRNGRIGFVFQDHHLLPQYTILENTLIPAVVASPAAAAARDRAVDLLGRVGLGHRLDHRPSEISGGERQRAAVARALVNRPALILCDEPTGNLDETSARAVAELLFELHEREGSILVVVTHSEDLAGRFQRRFRLAEGVCSEV